MRRPRRRERVVLVLIVAAFAASVAYSIAERVPFENDETVYAVQSRAWASGGPVTGVGLQRAPLLPAIGTLIYKAGARTEAPFRIVGLVFGVAAVVLVWALGRGIAGETAGLLAAAVFASAPSILQRSAQFMTDVPATAFLLALTLVLWLNRERATWSLLLAAPFGAGAFYARYASILPIALIILAAIVLWRRAFAARPAIAVGAVCLFAALLIPHIVHAVNVTGRPWGLVTYTARFAGRRYVGEGIVRYIAWLPFDLAGPLAGATMLAAIVTAVARSKRRAAFLIVPAVADIVLIGLAEHGDKRFIFFPVALLCVAGAIVVAEHIGAKRALAAAAALAVVAAGIFTAIRTNRTRDAREPPLLAGHVVAARAPHPCTVLAAEIAETTWYTGCSTYYFGTHGADFAVFYRGGGTRLAVQPAVPPTDAVETVPVLDRGRLVATVFRLSRPVQ
jgi:4-amino-4-deoxy-L-arabinose transferase-like glycosyltransferase